MECNSVEDTSRSVMWLASYVCFTDAFDLLKSLTLLLHLLLVD